jgi:AbrB family looped-hinge helix DNA binding protein
MPVSKLGQRRQVVIPKEIWDSLDLVVGDFVEVEQVKGSIALKPKKLVDADDMLTPEEEALVRRGEEELRTGEYVTLKQLEHDMGRKARQSRRKTTRKTSS